VDTTTASCLAVINIKLCESRNATFALNGSLKWNKRTLLDCRAIAFSAVPSFGKLTRGETVQSWKISSNVLF